VTAPDGIGLGGFERIRRHRDALVGVQVLPDGSRRVVRLQLKGDRAVTDAVVIDASLGDTGSTFVTVSGDDVYYLLTQPADSPTTPSAKVMTVVVKRIRLP
jgi:hypothetical protein